MIRSARPTVSPVASIVFAWNLFRFVRTNGWTTCAKTLIATGRGCGSAEWIKKIVFLRGIFPGNFWLHPLFFQNALQLCLLLLLLFMESWAVTGPGRGSQTTNEKRHRDILTPCSCWHTVLGMNNLSFFPFSIYKEYLVQLSHPVDNRYKTKGPWKYWIWK